MRLCNLRDVSTMPRKSKVVILATSLHTPSRTCQNDNFGRSRQLQQKAPPPATGHRHNTLDISVEADGAPKEWLIKVLSKIYRSHYPIEFRIVSYCQSRDTRENPLRFADNFSNVCNNAIDSLGTRPAGSVCDRGRQQRGPQRVSHRRRSGHRCRATRRQSGALRRAGRALRIPQPASTPAPSCQSARPIRVPGKSWPPPPFHLAVPEAAAQPQQVHRFPTPVVK